MSMLGLFSQAGDANAPRSPDDLAERRKLARKLIEQGSDYSPVQHWAQGLARVAAGALGGYDSRMADQDEKAARSEANKAFEQLFGGGGGESIAAATPATGAMPSVGANATEVSDRFLGTAREAGLTNPYGLAALGATGQRESSWSPDRVNASWSDPSESGQAGTSGGALSWRGPRLAALQSFARQNGEQGNGSPETQARFFAQEDPKLIAALQSAKSPDEAIGLMNNAWRFAGYDRPGGEAGARVAAARSWAERMGGGAVTPGQTAMAQTLVQRGPAPVEPVTDDRLGAASAAQSAGMADKPGAGAQNAQFFIPGRPQVVAQGQPAQAAPSGDNARMRGAMAILNNPFSAPGARAYAQSILTQERKDPRDGVIKDLTIEEKRKSLGRVETETMTAPDGTVFEREKGKPGAAWTQTIQLPQKAEDRTNYQRELDDENKARAARGEKPLSIMEYRTQVGRANAPSVNIDQKQEGSFAQETGKALAKRFDGLATEGDEAAQNLGLVSELRRLGQRIDFGAPAAVKSALGRLGVKTEGVSDIEAFNTLTARLTPQQRLPGAGATSDFDAKMFKESLPQLMNTPEGNTLVLDAIEKLSQNRIARGEVAMRVQMGELTPKEAMGEIRKLQSEAKALSDSVREYGKPKSAQPGPAQPAQSPDGWQDMGGGVRVREKR